MDPIRYPHAILDEDTGELISDAEVAEIPFTALTSKRRTERVGCRLVVRRVKRRNATGQVALFDTWRYHAFITNSTLDTVEADVQHRRHAIIEQTIAELKTGPLGHLPSGRFHANAAWLGVRVHHVQHRPRHRGRCRHHNRTHGHGPAHPDRRPRPDRGHRTPTRPAPTRPVAMEDASARLRATATSPPSPA